MNRKQATNTQASGRGLAVAVVAVISLGFGFALLQRGLLIATEEQVGRASALISFDVLLWGVWLALSPVAVAAARRWPLRLFPIIDLLCHAGTAIGLALVHTILLTVLLRLGQSAPSPISVFEVSTDLLSWRLAIDALVYATLVAVVVALDATRREHARDRAALASSAESTKAQLAALELQIQPHFLFNTLNTATMLAHSGRSAESAEVITRLSDLLRELVSRSPGETVSLRQELSFITRYLDIEKTRFAGRLRTTIKASDDAMLVAVPRLLLQPVIENAVRHGLSRSSTSGEIGVSASVEGGRTLVITVSDDGPGPGSPANGHSGLGLQNTRSRLRTLFGERSGLDLTAGVGGGSIVTIHLPAAQ